MSDPGDILDGYRLDAVIGRGGMGTVYRATDLALEKTVAVKVIAPHLADDETFVQRFREEAKALARLDADGIVDVHAMRETDEALFFVMEHVEGPSLETVLHRRGALDPAEAVSLLRQVLAAVGQAHAAGVLHRDLKPSNILLDADGQAVITDFGLAKILASDADLTATHEQLGTVAYMSPEQVEGLQNVDETSDLFSVGLIAYEVLTGRLPFDRSQSDFVVQRALVEESFPPPSAYAPDVPLLVEQVVLDLLAKDPAERPPDAQSARERLPTPHQDEETPILSPEAQSTPDAALSVPQWIGLTAAVLLVLAGTYTGVRATLGLPIFAVSAPTPPDSARLTAEVSGPAQRPPATRDSNRAAARPTSSSSDDAPPETTSTDEPQPDAPTSSNSSSGTPPPARSRSSPPPTSDTASPRGTEPQPLHGSLVVRSRPDSASVRLADSLAGRTPLTIGTLSPGQYPVSLHLEGHRPFETTIQVTEGDTAEVAPALPPNPAVLRVRARPDAEVRIDGVRRPPDANGLVVDSLSPGTHRLTLTSNLGRWETQLQLKAGEQYRRTVDFTQRVTVAVTAHTPEGRPLPNATVQVDGETVGYTPQRLTRHVGQHTIRVEKDGYVPAERTVLFKSDLDRPLEFELIPTSN